MTSEPPARVGDVIGPLEVGSIAHGGHWVARHEGFVWFVRHALEGELVSVRVTEVSRRFGRADVVTVERASQHRVAPPCPVAGRCGGCDFQHVDVAHTRELKRQVLTEHLTRAGVPFVGEVEAVTPEGFAWRTRMRYQRAPGGWGLFAHRSREVVALPEGGCRIAAPAVSCPDADGDGPLLGVAAASGTVWVPGGEPAPLVTEEAAGRRWRVHADGFWQVHPQAADTLASAVVTRLAPHKGERALDLYCGVGLFAGALAEQGVRVHGIEGNRRAVALARRNVPEATFAVANLARGVRLRRADLVVLDPPRSGAGERLMRQVLELGPRRIAYVACDPAALARDVRVAGDAGWRVESVRAFDLFPLTHHIEAVAILAPAKDDSAR